MNFRPSDWRTPWVAAGIAMTLLACGCGNHADAPSPAAPVDVVSSSAGASDMAKQQAAMQQQLARQKQQEALLHTAPAPSVPQ